MQLESSSSTGGQKEEANAPPPPASKSPARMRESFNKLSTFKKGSNIPGLSSDNVLQIYGIPKPRLPASRVRDLGKEILARANKCTWYENMQQAEVIERVTHREKPKKKEEVKVVDAPGFAAASVEDNTKLLRRLEEQQLELMKQQKVLHEKIGKQLPTLTKGSEVTILDGQDDEKTTLTSASKIGSCQRRLRGEVAHLCAKRDEGSIKSLIWCQQDLNGPSESTEDVNNPTEDHEMSRKVQGNFMTSNITTQPAKKLRNACVEKADSSMEIHDLLVNKFSDNSLN